jgi:hypothetical protein
VDLISCEMREALVWEKENERDIREEKEIGGLERNMRWTKIEILKIMSYIWGKKLKKLTLE